MKSAQSNSERSKRWREKKKRESPDYFKNYKKKRKYGEQIFHGSGEEDKNYSSTCASNEIPNMSEESNNIENKISYSQEEEELLDLDQLPEGYYYLPASHAVFNCPFTMIVGGPTGCGKSTFVSRLLENKESMFNPPPLEVRWYHCQTQPFHLKLREMYPDMIIHEGLPDPRDFDPEIPKLVILDDMMQELCDKRSDLACLFTKTSHHTNSSIIFITQNIFQQNKNFRTAAVNTQHLVLMKNPRDINQISTLQTQMFGKSTSKTGRFLQDIYKHATAYPHSYLLIMTDQYTPNELRIRSRIFPFEENYIYGE